MQLRPDEKYCIDYPDYLKNLPAPPKWGKKLAPSTSTTTSSTSTSYSSSNSSKPIGAYFSFGYTGSFNLENETESSFFNFNKYGFACSSETLSDQGDIFAIFSFDYLIDHSEEKTIDSWLVGFDRGYGLLSFFQPYLGGSLGMKWTDSFSWKNIGFAWKVNGGIRIPLSSFTVRTDISYGTILYLAETVAVGMYF